MSGRYKLFSRVGSGSSVCEAMLALTGLPYELVELERWKDKAPDALLAVNPLGQIPTLIFPDGTVMTESAAILLYLADIAPQAGLAPPPADPMRSRYLRWMVYLAANSYMTALRIYYPDRYAADAVSVKDAAIQRGAFEWRVFSEELGRGPFLLGPKMSAADLYAAMLLSWDLNQDQLYARHPNLQALYHGVTSDPRLTDVWKRHGV